MEGRRERGREGGRGRGGREGGREGRRGEGGKEMGRGGGRKGWMKGREGESESNQISVAHDRITWHLLQVSEVYMNGSVD